MSNSTKVYRTALIGCGSRGMSLRNTANQVDQIDVIAAADMNSVNFEKLESEGIKTDAEKRVAGYSYRCHAHFFTLPSCQSCVGFPHYRAVSRKIHDYQTAGSRSFDSKSR